MKLKQVLERENDLPSLRKIVQDLKDKELTLEYQLACRRLPEFEEELIQILLLVSDLKIYRKRIFKQFRSISVGEKNLLDILMKAIEFAKMREKDLEECPPDRRDSLEALLTLQRTRVSEILESGCTTPAQRKLLLQIRELKFKISEAIEGWQNRFVDKQFDIFLLFPSLESLFQEFQYFG